jgi:hypothetical protein
MFKDWRFYAVVAGVALAVDMFGEPVAARVRGFLGLGPGPTASV